MKVIVILILCIPLHCTDHFVDKCSYRYIIKYFNGRDVRSDDICYYLT